MIYRATGPATRCVTCAVLVVLAGCGPLVEPEQVFTPDELEALEGAPPAAWTREPNPSGPGYFAGPEGGELRYYEPLAGDRRYRRQLEGRRGGRTSMGD